MNEGIITRRKKRTLTGDREDSAAKRTRTGNIECLNEEKAGTGSEPLTRQRKKVLIVVSYWLTFLHIFCCCCFTHTLGLIS